MNTGGIRRQLHTLRKWTKLCGLCSLLMFLPGCWDYQSINTRSAAIGLAFDPVPDHPEMIHLTVQLPVFTTGSTTGGGGTSGGNVAHDYQNLSADGYSIAEAMRQVQTETQKNIDEAELRSIIVSQKLPPKMMDSIIGQLVRDSTVNKLAYIVSTDGKAADILNAEPQDGAAADVLSKKLSAGFRQHGYFVRRPLWEYWRDAVDIGMTPIVPIARTVTSEGNASQGSGGMKDGLQVSGFEVYQNSKPVLAFDRRQALAYNMLMGDVKKMASDLPIKGGRLALLDLESTAKLRCIGSPDHVYLVGRIAIQGTLADSASNMNPVSEENLNQLEQQVSSYYAKEIYGIIRLAQAQQVDIFGFGKMYLHRYPEQKDIIARNWNQMFAHATPRIQVTTKIESKGLLI